jgi:hypothetical protein
MAVKARKANKNSVPHPGGRPPKFDEPRRVVTVTLPERTLRQLAAVEPDLARAVVKVAQKALAGGRSPKAPVELIEAFPGTSVIVVAASRALRKIPWLRLIEIAPSRFLLTIVPGTPVETFEVELLDALESLPKDDHHERKILTELHRSLRSLRRGGAIRKAEILFVGGATPWPQSP